MLTVDPASAIPPFEQLRQQLVTQITSGELAHGSRLPTVRRLADDLGLAPNTVARCYRELEQAGVIETRGRNGSFVSWSADAGEARVEQAAQQLVVLAREHGVAAERVRALLDAAFGA
nr:GntR family transcriptional regulator [Protaetiibacter larvae]